MIDEYDEEAEDDSQVQQASHLKVKWYLIHKESAFCKFWDFIITLTLEYSLFVTPFLLVFPCLYTCTIDTTCPKNDPNTCAGNTL